MWPCAPDKNGCVMSNQWTDDDFEEDDESQQNQQAQLPKGFRTQLNKVQKENKELRESNAKLLVQVRQTAIATALGAKGVDPKVAKLVPSEIEPTPEAVEAWLADYADLFAPKATAEGDGAGGNTDEGQGDGDGENAEYAAQMGRISTVANGAQAPGRQQDILKQITDPAMTQEKLMELITAHGGGFGSG